VLSNFEYLLNIPYALNRDKGRCRICGEYLSIVDTQTHHINPKLPSNQVNKVMNLASTHKKCHKMIHDKKDHSYLGDTIWNKIIKFRKKLG